MSNAPHELGCSRSLLGFGDRQPGTNSCLLAETGSARRCFRRSKYFVECFSPGRKGWSLPSSMAIASAAAVLFLCSLSIVEKGLGWNLRDGSLNYETPKPEVQKLLQDHDFSVEIFWPNYEPGLGESDLGTAIMGWCWVQFQRKEDAQRAKEVLNGSILYGRRIKTGSITHQVSVSLVQLYQGSRS